DGVEHVVYFFYGDPVGNPTLKDGLDLLRPLLQNACGRSAVPCHWLDLRPVFAGHPEYVGTDGLVFTDAGASAAAAATFAFMQKQCVAN
ncbi:MAG TPA: SGNH/GDSL hydrolase family protein, partial [Polyangiaceae bacterium]|nr:SGNH/GDSL hydrolase family protein [Polyangiaceae bacterium]